MNIELLRRAQASIADCNNIYGPNDWRYCIAGHILRANGTPLTLENWAKRSVPREALDALGIHGRPRMRLRAMFNIWYERPEAVEALGVFISDLELTQPTPVPALEPTHPHLACSPALEPAAQSRRARAGEHREREQEREQKEEELELVGA